MKLNHLHSAWRLLRMLQLVFMGCVLFQVATVMHVHDLQYRQPSASDDSDDPYSSYAAAVHAHRKQHPGTRVTAPTIFDALAKPVRVAVMTRWPADVIKLEYSKFERPKACQFRDTEESIQCEWFKGFLDDDGADAADAWWYYAPYMMTPTTSKLQRPPRSDALMVVMSLDPSATSPQLDQPSFMEQFDVEMSYRLCSHVGTYFHPPSKAGLQQVLSEPLPFEAKVDGIAFVSSRCEVPSGRSALVQAMADTKMYRVASYGGCLKSHVKAAANITKGDILRQYKFCIAIEDVASRDYVTEQLFDALRAGCVPIYLGAPNALLDLLPTGSVLDYSRFESVEELMSEVARLSQDPVAYGQYLAWKQLPFSQQVPGFQRYMAQAEVVQGKSPQCRLCNLLMERRLQPGLLKQRPTCAGNGTWGKRAGGSSWGEGAAALADAQKAWQAAVGP